VRVGYTSRGEGATRRIEKAICVIKPKVNPVCEFKPEAINVAIDQALKGYDFALWQSALSQKQTFAKAFKVDLGS